MLCTPKEIHSGLLGCGKKALELKIIFIFMLKYIKKINIHNYLIYSLTPSLCMSESPLPTTHSPRGPGGRADAPQCEGGKGVALSHSFTFNVC